MSAYMTVLLLFQSFLGILYAWLGLLTAIFMAGAAIGAVTERLLFRAFRSIKTLIGESTLTKLFPLLPTIIPHGRNAAQVVGEK